MGCDIHLAVERRTADGWERQAAHFAGRPYVLFAALAGVRNVGRGFNPLTPIDEPRGLPEDVSAETRAESDEWGIDGHSHSWLSLPELLTHDWDQEVARSCWVRRLRGLPPRRNENDDEFAQRLEAAANSLGGLPPAEYWHYETCSCSSEGQGLSGWRGIRWLEPLGDLVGTEWWRLVARMARIAGDDLSSVRVVFWFDN